MVPLQMYTVNLCERSSAFWVCSAVGRRWGFCLCRSTSKRLKCDFVFAGRSPICSGPAKKSSKITYVAMVQSSRLMYDKFMELLNLYQEALVWALSQQQPSRSISCHLADKSSQKSQFSGTLSRRTGKKNHITDFWDCFTTSKCGIFSVAISQRMVPAEIPNVSTHVQKYQQWINTSRISCRKKRGQPRASDSPPWSVLVPGMQIFVSSLAKEKDWFSFFWIFLPSTEDFLI